MTFLDVIATPFYLMFGVAALFIILGIGCLVVLTMVIFALFQRLSKDKNGKKEAENLDK